MNPNLTDEQKHAATTRGRSLLLSAAAGSGKTTVLTERVIDYLKSGGSLERLLIVTFTEKAAGEMKGRIAQALLEASAKEPDGHLRDEVRRLPDALIMTFHAFGDHLVRRYGALFGIDPESDVLDESQAKDLADTVLDRVLPASPQTLQLLPYFGGRGEASLRSALQEAISYARTLPDPEGWLMGLGTGFLDGHRLKEIQEITFREGARTFVRLARETEGASRFCRSYGFDEVADAMEAHALELAQWALAFQTTRDWTAPPEREKLPSIRGGDPDLVKAAKRPWERVKDEMDAQSAWYGYWLESGRLDEEARRLQEIALPFSTLAVTYHGALEDEKRKRHRIDFADQAIWAFRLLAGENAPPEVARELRDRFDEILVDEFQDVNAVQHDLIRALARADGDPRGGNLFTVGDVKQSIYLFVHAAPDLFLRLHKEYGDPQPGVPGPWRLPLSENFRSTGAIVDAVNLVFQNVMRAGDSGGITYDQQAALKMRRPPHTWDFAVAETVDLVLLPKATDEIEFEEPEEGGEEDEAQPPLDLEDTTAMEREAHWIAGEIKTMVSRGDPIWDRNQKIKRKVSYGDIAILMRGLQGAAAPFLQVLTERGIPAYGSLKTGYLASLEFQTLRSLLRTVELPSRDLDLTVSLRAPFFAFSLKEITEIRQMRKGSLWEALRESSNQNSPLGEKARHATSRIAHWRRLAFLSSVAEVVETILKETRYADRVVSLPQAVQRLADIEAFQELARGFSTREGGSLGSFLESFENVEARRDDLEPPSALGEADDVVRLSTIHRSKGLEYPVVFIARAGMRFRDRLGKDSGKFLVFHKDLGLGITSVDMDEGLIYSSPMIRALELTQAEEKLREEMRLLYVAMTRARDRLVIVGTVDNLEREKQKWEMDGKNLPLHPDAALAATSVLDWLAPVALANEGGALRLVPPRLALTHGERGSESEGEGVLQAARIEKLREAYKNLHDEDMPLPEAPPLRLTPTALDEEAEADLEPDANTRRRFPSPPPRPGSPPPAVVGTLTHQFLGLMDPFGVMSREMIRGQLEDLIQRGLMPEEAELYVDLKAVLGFWESPLGQRIRESKGRLLREQPFTLLVDAQGRPGGDIVLQGRIDLLLVEGDKALVVDFKTDRIKKEDVLARAASYGPQVGVYKQAVATLSTATSIEACLYFTALDQIVEIA